MIDKEVLCIKTNINQSGELAVKEGNVYLIQGLQKCTCGFLAYDVGVKSLRLERVKCSGCGKLSNPTYTWRQASTRFVFMDELDISSITENVKEEAL